MGSWAFKGHSRRLNFGLFVIKAPFGDHDGSGTSFQGVDTEMTTVNKSNDRNVDEGRQNAVLIWWSLNLSLGYRIYFDGYPTAELSPTNRVQPSQPVP
jgi:hypothetical protein